MSLKKNWNFSKAQFLWCDCTFKKQCTVSVTLTIDIWRSMFFQWIECHPINILHKFQIDISSNSREIKYQNIGRTHTHTDRQTHTHTDRQTDRVKTIPRNPLRGRGNYVLELLDIVIRSLPIIYNDQWTRQWHICFWSFSFDKINTYYLLIT